MDGSEEEKEFGRRALDAEFWRRLFLHMTSEENKFLEGSARMDRIEKDLQPIKKMYWAIVGSAGVGAGVGALLLCLLTYVYIADKSEFKEVQKAILIQGNAIERLLSVQQSMDNSHRRDIDRLEREQERLTDGKGTRK